MTFILKNDCCILFLHQSTIDNYIEMLDNLNKIKFFPAYFRKYKESL